MKQALNLTVALTVTILWATAGPAQAAGDDPLLVAPDVLIIVDTSGSMTNNVPMSDTGAPTRQMVLREVLTGTYGPADSDKGVCNSAQKADGILDKYGGMIRFAFGTFDNDDSDTWDYGSDTYHLGLKAPGSTGGGLVYPIDDINNPDALAAHSSVVQDQACYAGASNNTPLFAAMKDAEYMFTDPTGNWKAVLGYTDPLENCREEFVILLTDGRQNEYFDTNFITAADAAASLYANNIPVYVIGFSDPTETDLQEDVDEIAAAGGTTSALLATDKEKLFEKFDQIMAEILEGTASRTRITTQPSVGAFDTMFRYYAYFQVAYGASWKGFLVREKLGTEDTDGDGLPDPIETLYFNEELADQAWNQRTIYTITSDPRSTGFTNPDDPDDPLNYELPRDLVRLGPTVSSADIGTLRPLMCVENNAEDMDGDGDADDSDISQLVTTVVEFLHGKPDTPTSGGYFKLEGPQLADIFHSSPVIVPPPTALAPDFRYQLYHEKNKDRHTMLYVGANDGLLHAFVAEDHDEDSNDETGKELWAFIPNYLLSKINNVRRGHNLFVDGTPVVRDVFFRNVKTTDEDGNPLGTGIMGEYRTVLICGLRGGGPAYFALDVTDPQNPKYLWEYRVNVPITMSYDDAQCQAFAPVETWARPIVGQVWLKVGDDYISKTVAIVPGGFQNPAALSEVKSCIEFVELMTAPGGLHVIDVETGKLLERFRFGPGGASAENWEELEKYYQQLRDCHYAIENPGAPDADPSTCEGWSAEFTSDGYKGTVSWAWGTDKLEAGEWGCKEDRHSILYPPGAPPGITEKCVEMPPDASWDYHKRCCYYAEQECASKSDCHASDDCVDGHCTCDPTDNGVGPCHYAYMANYDTNGDLVDAVLKFKGDNCPHLDVANNKNHMRLELGTGFRIESVAGTPAAYNTAFGEYLTRIFLPTTAGNVWRLDVGNGNYDKARFSDTDYGEGDIIGPYTVSAGGTSITYDWEVGSTPWYTASGGRPIMTEPTIALDYERNLVLFFGTGDAANLEYITTPPTEHFYAVKETRTEDDELFMQPDDTGTDFHAPMALTDPGERIYGAPLVLGGNVFFTTYVPVNDMCLPGQSYTYGMTFDTFDGIFDSGAKRVSAGEGTASPPSLQWSASGESSAVIQVKAAVKKIPVSVRSTAQILQWGKVL